MKNIRLLTGGMVIGVALGWLTLYLLGVPMPDGENGSSTDAALKLAIGIIARAFVALQVVLSLRGVAPAPRRPSISRGTAAGSVAGFTSTLAHAAGPVVTMYLLPQRMSRARFVATTALYYWIGNLLKVPPYLVLGMIDAGSLAASLWLVPMVVIGALLGVFLHSRVGERSFRAVVYVLLTLTGLHLCVQGARALGS